MPNEDNTDSNSNSENSNHEHQRHSEHHDHREGHEHHNEGHEHDYHHSEHHNHSNPPKHADHHAHEHPNPEHHGHIHHENEHHNYQAHHHRPLSETTQPFKAIKHFWNFLKKDTWQSWLVSLILIVVIIKFVFFPLLSLLTGTSLPLVVVESCSMYHDTGNIDTWWTNNGAWYSTRNITLQDFKKFSLTNGLNKGDIILVLGAKNPKPGQIIIFAPNRGSIANHPIIHRVISTSPLGTKGDNNFGQLVPANNPELIDETSIQQNQIVGKAVFRIPYLGWIKLIFFEFSKTSQNRGFCK